MSLLVDSCIMFASLVSMRIYTDTLRRRLPPACTRDDTFTLLTYIYWAGCLEIFCCFDELRNGM